LGRRKEGERDSEKKKDAGLILKKKKEHREKEILKKTGEREQGRTTATRRKDRQKNQTGEGPRKGSERQFARHLKKKTRHWKKGVSMEEGS